MFDWYKLFNLTEWLEEELVSRKLTVFLDGIGQKEIMIFQGNETSILVDDDILLPVKFNEENPWVKSGYGVFVDVNQDVWVGFEVDA